MSVPARREVRRRAAHPPVGAESWESVMPWNVRTTGPHAPAAASPGGLR